MCSHAEGWQGNQVVCTRDLLSEALLSVSRADVPERVHIEDVENIWVDFWQQAGIGVQLGKGVLLPWIATSSWTSDYLQPVMLTCGHTSTRSWQNTGSIFAHIDYDSMVHRHSICVKRARIASSFFGPKTVLTAGNCRLIVEKSLSLLSYHLQQGHQLQVELPGLGWVHCHIHDIYAEHSCTNTPESEVYASPVAGSVAELASTFLSEAYASSAARDVQLEVPPRPRQLSMLPILCFRHRMQGSVVKWQSLHELAKCRRCKERGAHQIVLINELPRIFPFMLLPKPAMGTPTEQLTSVLHHCRAGDKNATGYATGFLLEESLKHHCGDLLAPLPNKTLQELFVVHSDARKKYVHYKPFLTALRKQLPKPLCVKAEAEPASDTDVVNTGCSSHGDVGHMAPELQQLVSKPSPAQRGGCRTSSKTQRPAKVPTSAPPAKPASDAPKDLRAEQPRQALALQPALAPQLALVPQQALAPGTASPAGRKIAAHHTATTKAHQQADLNGKSVVPAVVSEYQLAAPKVVVAAAARASAAAPMAKAPAAPSAAKDAVALLVPHNCAAISATKDATAMHTAKDGAAVSAAKNAADAAAACAATAERLVAMEESVIADRQAASVQANAVLDEMLQRVAVHEQACSACVATSNRLAAGEEARAAASTAAFNRTAAVLDAILQRVAASEEVAATDREATSDQAARTAAAANAAQNAAEAVAVACTAAAEKLAASETRFASDRDLASEHMSAAASASAAASQHATTVLDAVMQCVAASEKHAAEDRETNADQTARTAAAITAAQDAAAAVAAACITTAEKLTAFETRSALDRDQASERVSAALDAVMQHVADAKNAAAMDRQAAAKHAGVTTMMESCATMGRASTVIRRGSHRELGTSLSQRHAGDERIAVIERNAAADRATTAEKIAVIEQSAAVNRVAAIEAQAAAERVAAAEKLAAIEETEAAYRIAAAQDMADGAKQRASKQSCTITASLQRPFGLRDNYTSFYLAQHTSGSAGSATKMPSQEEQTRPALGSFLWMDTDAATQVTSDADMLHSSGILLPTVAIVLKSPVQSVKRSAGHMVDGWKQQLHEQQCSAQQLLDGWQLKLDEMARQLDAL